MTEIKTRHLIENGIINLGGCLVALLVGINLLFNYLNNRLGNEALLIQNEVQTAQRAQYFLRQVALRMEEENKPDMTELLNKYGIRVNRNQNTEKK